MSTTPTEYVTVAEAAADYRCSIKTVRRRIADGTLPAYRMGGRVIRIRRADLEQLVRPVPTRGTAA